MEISNVNGGFTASSPQVSRSSSSTSDTSVSSDSVIATSSVATQVQAPTQVQAQTSTSGVESVTQMKQLEAKGEQLSLSDKEVVKALDKALKAVAGHTTTLDFAIHKATKQIMVKVLDKETGEVIREIPPEKNFDFLANLWKMAGILVDKRT